MGVGVTLCPKWPANDLWRPYSDPNCAGAVFRASILAILESGFCLAAVVTVILNLIIPFEEENTVIPLDGDDTPPNRTLTTATSLGKPFLNEEDVSTSSGKAKVQPPAAVQMV